ncbi:MAG: YihY family inner membrane protein [Sulfuricellaceae bacterium]
MPLFLSDLLPFFRLIRLRFNEDRCLQVAASLTYTTLLSLVPVITITLTMLSSFPAFGEMMTQIKIFLLANMVPTSAGKIISVYALQFSDNAARLTVVGIALLALTAFVLMMTINNAFNVIWRVRKRRSVMRRLTVYWVVLTLGPLLLGASLSTTYYLLGLSLGWVKDAPFIGILVLKLTPMAITIIAFALLYWAVPNRPVRFSHALLAGMLAGIAFELMKKLFALYLAAFPTYTLVYGAFAAVPVFLAWVYLSWLVVLIGAVFAAALPYWHNPIRQHERSAANDFMQALAVLQALYCAHQSGESLKPAQLQLTLHVELEEAEYTLERLEMARWISRTADNGWVLSRNPETISLAGIFREFVFRPDMAQRLPESLEAALSPWLVDLQTALQGERNISLKALCEIR